MDNNVSERRFSKIRQPKGSVLVCQRHPNIPSLLGLTSTIKVSIMLLANF